MPPSSAPIPSPCGRTMVLAVALLLGLGAGALAQESEPERETTARESGGRETGQDPQAAGQPTSEAAPEPEPGQVADPDLDVATIVDRHLQRRLPDSPVQSVTADGQLVFMGLELPLEITIARPRSSRLEADMADTPLILAFDGESAWTVSPMQGYFEPQQLDEEGEEAVALFAEFLWGLLDGMEERGVEVELEGVETVDGDETYALRLTGPYQRRLFLGGEDFLERRLSLETVFLGQEQAIDAMLDDYREVEGLMVPHDIRLLSNGAPLAHVVLDTVQVNEAVDPSIFEQPPPPPEPAPAETPPGEEAAEEPGSPPPAEGGGPS